MPSINRNKIYLPNTVYHVYNRGVNKQAIFHHNKDYLFYLLCLKEYLSPKHVLIDELNAATISEVTKQKKLEYLLKLKNFYGAIDLLAYCLMPNHIHLLLKQDDAHDMEKFMQSLHTRYGKHHAKRYNRIGPLYQDRYRAKPILDSQYLLDVSRYIHLNPIGLGINFDTYSWSSVRFYKSTKNPQWLNKSVR